MLLAVNSGFIDALGFVALGGVFTSVMTGNMVLLGVSAGSADTDLALYTLTALALFILGCMCGAQVAGRAMPGDPVWPKAVSRALLVECALVVSFGVGWWLSGAHPSSLESHVLLGLNAAALGVQSSAVQRFGVPGLSTTYLTGTLTQLVRSISHGSSKGLGLSGGLLAALIVGAALGAILTLQMWHLAAVVPSLAIVAVLVGARRVTRS